MDETIDWSVEGFIAVVWLSSECDSEQLSSYSFIYSFILICKLALTRLSTYVELYYGKSKKSTHKHININHSRYPNWYGTESNTSLTSPMLTRYTRHPWKHATHATHASTPPTPPTLGCYQRNHTTMPPTLARTVCHFSNSKLLYLPKGICWIDSQSKKLIHLKYLILETPYIFFSIFSWYFSFMYTKHSIACVFRY